MISHYLIWICMVSDCIHLPAWYTSPFKYIYLMYLIPFDAWTVKKYPDISSECSVNYLKLQPGCTVISLTHLSSNSWLLKITIPLLFFRPPSWCWVYCPQHSFPWQFLTKARRVLRGSGFPWKRVQNIPSAFTWSNDDEHVSQPTPAKTSYHGKQSVFPEDVKIWDLVFASSKHSPSPQKGQLPCTVGEELARTMQSNYHCEDAFSPSSLPCFGHALQPLGAFQWLLCSCVSASWTISPSPWNPAHATPPTFTFWFQLQMGTREKKGKIMGARRWRSETVMKLKA